MSPVAVIMALVIRGGVAIKDHPIWTKHSKSCSKVSPAFLVVVVVAAAVLPKAVRLAL
jgi:hypothetical protein